ncbi:hypothetical protein, partial [Xanthomonas perforans]|uniref:hypothetical protein n=1 Tax=Xanthomonas perforans TaxID=442694 RepID=UPI001F30AAA3
MARTTGLCASATQRGPLQQARCDHAARRAYARRAMQSRSKIELDALRQGQRIGVVDGVGLTTHI